MRLKVTVDYSQTKEQMIQVGKYDYVNDFLRDNDPVEGKIAGSGIVSVNLELIHFNRAIFTADAIKKIKKKGYELAGDKHLYAIGEQHPNLQKEFPIVALGSVWRGSDGYRSVACLDGWDDERGLGLHWHGNGWRGGYRFLVVRK